MLSIPRDTDGLGGPRRQRRFALLFGLLLLGGCATTVIPPPSPAQPLSVLLLDHGRHTSLVLPDNGASVRYAYGDWRWYAEGKTGFASGFAALFLSTDAALGRSDLSVPTDLRLVERTLTVGIEQLWAIEVEAEAVERLRQRLDSIHAAGAPKLFSPSADLLFAPHPDPYHLMHNSNTVVAEWLDALGCEVRGGAMTANWRVVEP